MKFRGRIVTFNGSDEDHINITVAGAGKAHHAGREQEYTGVLRIETPRMLVRDFKLGDMFEVTLSKIADS